MRRRRLWTALVSACMAPSIPHQGNRTRYISPPCRTGRRKSSAAARSARPASRPRRRGPRAVSGCSSRSADWSPWPRSPWSSCSCPARSAGAATATTAGAQPEQASNVTIPEQEIGDLQQAAKAAGCKLTNPEIEGATHEEREFTAADYKTNPPTSGNHFPTAAEDGVYSAGNAPDLGLLVHTLEHGRIDVQYKPGTPAETVAQLEALLAEQSDGYHMLLFENPTGMDAAVAATAWGHSLTCPEMNDQVFDAIRTFRNEYIDQGPEDVA